MDALAHAWGNDHIHDLDIFLFMKKAEMDPKQSITVPDILQCLSFESKYGKNAPAQNVTSLLELMLPDQRDGKAPLAHFKLESDAILVGRPWILM